MNLVERAKAGALTRREVEEIAQSLRDRRHRDPYEALHALGHASGPVHESVVAPYLDFVSDPMVVRLALQVLADYWGLRSRYSDRIIDFVRGVRWDVATGEYVRLAAIAQAGELVQVDRNRTALAELISVAKDPAVRTLIHDAAIDALEVAVGKSPADLRSPVRRQPSVALDTAAIERAEALAKRLAN